MATHSVLYKCPYCSHPHEVEPVRNGQVIQCDNPSCGKRFGLELAEAQPEDDRHNQNLIVPGGRQVEENRRDEDRQSATATAPAPKDAGRDVVNRREERTVKVIHPAIFRRYPLRTVGFTLLVLLGILFIIPGIATEMSALLVIGIVLAGIGLFMLGKWLLWSRTTTVTITTHRTILNFGYFGKSAVEVDHDDVDFLHVHRSNLNNLMRTGDLAIATKGQKKQLVLMAAPDPEETANLIRAQCSGEGQEVQQAHQEHQRQQEEQNNKEA